MVGCWVRVVVVVGIVGACTPRALPEPTRGAAAAADQPASRTAMEPGAPRRERERCRGPRCDRPDEPEPGSSDPSPPPSPPPPPALPAIPASAVQGWVARSGLSVAMFERDKGQLIHAGFRIASIAGYEVAGEQRVDAIWVQER